MKLSHAHRQGSRDPGKIAAAQLSRRRLLGGIGAGSVGAVALGAAGFGATAASAQPGQGTQFGRMFPGLPPFVPATQRHIDGLLDLGAPGGILDANDDLAAGPVELIIDPNLSANNPDNQTHTAGVTFFGQFLDHDMTFDTTSPLGVPTPPETSPNTRTPALDLDSVYGAGPVADSQLYEPGGVRLRIESGGIFEDVPRAGNGTAIISDPRNDEHAIISGLHAAFILFHNAVVQRLQDDGFAGNLFTEARRIVTWHYQWIIVNEFLPLIIGAPMVQNILNNGRQHYLPGGGQVVIPIEFQLSYRFGHSMIRPSYRLNLEGDNGEAFFGMIFDPAGQGQPDPVDLRGGTRAPRRFVGWQTFFDFGDGETRPNKRIDTVLSTPLFHLPLQTIPAGTPPTSLPQRNLLRHLTWEAPAGQMCAQLMGNPMLHLPQLAGIGGGLAFENQTPLWFYMLAEAEQLAGGLTLGPTGGRIVGEVFLGLLQLDPTSYLAVQPSWQPTLPSQTPGGFAMTDLLRFAGVDPTSRENGGGGNGNGNGTAGCTASLLVESQWSNGYVIQVNVTNNSGGPVSGWQVGLTLPAGHQINGQWNTQLTVAGTNLTATGLSWNSTLAPGQAAQWGFQASRPNDGQLASSPTCTAS